MIFDILQTALILLVLVKVFRQKPPVIPTPQIVSAQSCGAQPCLAQACGAQPCLAEPCKSEPCRADDPEPIYQALSRIEEAAYRLEDAVAKPPQIDLPRIVQQLKQLDPAVREKYIKRGRAFLRERLALREKAK